MSARIRFRVLLVAAVCASACAHAELKLAPLFTDNMVLQRERPVPVWGWAGGGETVTVEFAGQKQSAKADEAGKWTVRLDPMKASPAGRVLTVSTDPTSATGKLRLQNVLVGEVWVCSGQSNMEMGIGVVANGPQEIADAEFPLIRLFTVPRAVATTPQAGLGGTAEWKECSPLTVVAAGGWGGFSAAAYFFGRHLHQELNVPVGLIGSSWGGTVCEAWTSADTLKDLPDFAPALAQLEQLPTAKKPIDRAAVMAAWWKKNDPGSRGGQAWAAPDLNAADWKTMDLPTAWEEAGLTNYNGVVWFRKEFELPESWAGHDLMLDLGKIDDEDTTWINGVKIGAMNTFDAERNYKVPATALKSGRNVIAVRVLDTGGPGGMYGPAERMNVGLHDNTRIDPIPLAGEWSYYDSVSLKKTALPQMPGLGNPNVVTVLYNGMIAPLVPYGIRGAIWYQGESNAGRAYQYRALFSAMIRDWRMHWGEGAFPFGFVQLANFKAVKAEPSESEWAELREAQHMALALPNTGEAVIIDIGNGSDIHPKNKQEVGRRLALWAEAEVYGRDIVYSGPAYQSMKIKGSKILLSFDHVGGGLVAQGDEPLRQFAIAGEDRQFVWADAVIEGETVVVSSESVPHPVAVRYAWAGNPEGCNLYNKKGLPASPFRTDDWPGRTVDKR